MNTKLKNLKMRYQVHFYRVKISPIFCSHIKRSLRVLLRRLKNSQYQCVQKN